jgi:hypothetical protein
MTLKTLSVTIDEKLALIAPVLVRMEQRGGQDLRHLGTQLVDAMGLFQRNPGIEAAADDLYAAAAALIADSHLRSQPLVRKQCLLKEANLRSRNRCRTARSIRYPHWFFLNPGKRRCSHVEEPDRVDPGHLCASEAASDA